MTIQQIAEECGVSASTVSRALNGSPDVNKSVREKIKEAADRSGYCNAGKKRKKRKLGRPYIAVIVRSAKNLFYSEMLGKIEDTLRDTDYSMGVSRIADNGDEIEKAVSLEQEDRLAGIIFLGGRYDYTPSEISKISVPFVMCSYTNRFGTLSPKSFSAVSCDEYMVGYNTAKTLIDAGHRKIGALFTPVNDRSVSCLRYQGFCAALSDSGIMLDRDYVVEAERNEPESAFRGANSLLDRGLDMTALFTNSDAMAMGAVKAFDNRGIRVPDDISVIGVDGLSISEYLIPTLTTTVRPTEELARKSARLLIELIEEESENRQISLPTYLRQGASVKSLL